MRFYVDFDDCLCETGKSFTEIADRLFGKKVPYENMRFFNMQESFKLTDDEYEQLMIEGHRPEILLAYEETEGASKVLNEWIDKGHEVCVITGRPIATIDASKEWLNQHGLGRVKLYFLNKYGRDFFYKNNEFNLELDDYYKMSFDYAVEDSPMAYKYFDHLPDLQVMVYDRPWNQEDPFPGNNFYRCPSWEYIRNKVGI